nr:hypothetical protein Iba_chr11eCG9730 [Ipomoea batatas]
MSDQLNSVNLYSTFQSESSRIVANSAFGIPNPLQLPITSQGQLINATTMQPYMNPYSTMIGSSYIPPPRPSLSSLSEESNNINLNMMPPLTLSTMPPMDSLPAGLFPTGQQINQTPMHPYMFQHLDSYSTMAEYVPPQRASLFNLNEDSEYVINPNIIHPSQYVTTNARPPLMQALPMSDQLNSVNLYSTFQSESSRVVANSAFGIPNSLQLPITSQGQLINATTMQPYMNPYSTMIGSSYLYSPSKAFVELFE